VAFFLPDTQLQFEFFGLPTLHTRSMSHLTSGTSFTKVLPLALFRLLIHF